jgi:ferredoxin
MNVHVDASLCEGVGFCAEIVPDVFDTDMAPPARVRKPLVDSHELPSVYEAEQMCPVRAIRLDK